MTNTRAQEIAESVPYCGGTTLRIHADEKWESPIVSLRDDGDVDFIWTVNGWEVST